jgi:hypothetical protein
MTLPLRSLLVFFAAFALTAADKPDFTGTWKLNLAKSDFGQAPAPTSMVREVKHAEPNFALKTTQSGQAATFTTEVKFTTDGKEATNTTPRGEIKGSMKWDGATLVNEYKTKNPQFGELAIEDRWALSADGKTLTVKGRIRGDFGEVERTMVFEKQ